MKTAEDLVALFDAKTMPAAIRSYSKIVPDLRERISEGVQHIGGYNRWTLDALLKLLNAPETWQESCATAAAAAPSTTEARQTPEDMAAREDVIAGQPELSEKEQEIIGRLRKMKFGTWFEFKSGTGAVTRRIKLSWLSPLTATCMFVDRSGMQAEIKTLRELAQEILSGRAKVIPRPRHPFIERALVSIRNMLQVGSDARLRKGEQQQSESAQQA